MLLYSEFITMSTIGIYKDVRLKLCGTICAAVHVRR